MKKFIKIIICIIILLAVLCGYILWSSANVLTVNNYNLKTDKIKGNVNFVFISDMHNKEFGADNKNLVEKIKAQNPDFIAVGGDMVTSDVESREPIIKLLPKLCEIAPVYYVLGNHEKEYSDYNGLIKDIESSGAKLLNNEMVTLKISGGEEITIGGLTEFPYYEFEEPDYDNEARYFLDSFIENQKSSYSILLAHQPEFYFWKLKDMDLDLMVTGHTHGGLVRLPFIGGLYAPNQGWFPEYDMGYFSTNTANLIISSGLGNSKIIPRFNNNPDICVITVN
jgi:hypothetical protein